MSLSAWLQRLLGQGQTVADDAIGRSIEHAVDLIEPRLRLHGGYAERLRQPAQTLLAHAEHFATTVPGPVEVSRKCFGADPLVHALFGAADDVPRVLGLSAAVRAFAAEGAAPADGFFALLGVRRHEKRVLGVELQGEVLRHDIPQTAVYFRDHTFTGPSASEFEARQFLARSAFESVAMRLADELAALRRQRAELDARRSMLHARARGGGADAALATDISTADEASRQLTAALQPTALLDRAAALMTHPQDVLRLEDTTLTLSRMGIRVSGESTEASDTIRFPELVGRDRRRWVVLLVRVPRAELDEALARADAARRWIVI